MTSTRPRASASITRGELWPRPTRPRLRARLTYRLQRVLAPNRFYRWFAGHVESRRRLYAWFTRQERASKEQLFGCRMCGQCALPATGYACPMTCPKQLRNGPCGGVSPFGDCEVYPGVRCVWLIAHDRAEAAGRVGDLMLMQRPIDHRLWGASSWINYWQGRDEDLWTAIPGARSPSIHRIPPGRPSPPTTINSSAARDHRSVG